MNKLFTTIILIFVTSQFAYSQSVRLISLNRGDVLESGLSYNIKWSSNDVQNIKIEYSTDNGTSWNLVSNSFPAFVGNYRWPVPQLSSGQALLRISDINNYSISDTGSFIVASFFSEEQNIKQETINSPLGTTSSSTITSPNGGETWRVGSAIDIMWNDGDITESDVKIQYSTNSGSDWTDIISTTPNDGIFTWTNIQNTNTTQGRIRLVNTGDDSPYDMSDGNFTIIAISPNITHFPARILPWGNSIAFGWNIDIVTGTSEHTGDLAGFEYSLWNLLRADNYDFDFIGSEFSGYNKFPDYQNGGFGGTTISQMNDILEIGKNTKFTPNDIITYPNKYLNVYTPDIVLLHVGTNVQGNYSTQIERDNTATTETGKIDQMLDNIFDSDLNSNATNTWVILALVLNCDAAEEADLSAYYQVLNNDILAMANNRINSSDRILIVNMYDIPGFDYTTDVDLSDAIHPNYSGYNLMAGEWYKALKLILPAGSPTAPSFLEANVDAVAYVNIPFNYQAVAAGVGTPTYSITSGPGTINQYTGKVNWTPSAVGEVSMTITASNGVGTDANQNLTIHVLQQPTLESSLISYWRFDEDQSSGPFVDEYNLNNGYTESSLTSTTGQANGAYTFDGTNNKVNILDQPDFDFQTSSFTVEAWINLSSSGPSQDRAVVGKYGKYGNSYKVENVWWLGVDASNKATFFVGFGNSTSRDVVQVTSSTPISTDTWVHIVGIKNGSTDLQLYVNGSSASSAPTGSASNNNFHSPRPLNIGHWYNDKLFYGSIDEVAIYNDVLSGTTISDQYSRGMTYNEGYFDIHASVAAFLQGPYNSGTMSTTLNMGEDLPLSQPYDTSPWDYYGDESVSMIPNSDIVDWVLLELRSVDNGSAVVRRAAFIDKNGNIVDLDGTSPVNLAGLFSGDYYIVVRHRNHLAIMSANKVTLPNGSAYDFALGSGQYYGTNGAKELEQDVWGMIAGDANRDGDVDYNNDVLVEWLPNFGLDGYNYPADFNMNGTVDYSEDLLNKWLPNFGFSSQVP